MAAKRIEVACEIGTHVVRVWVLARGRRGLAAEIRSSRPIEPEDLAAFAMQQRQWLRGRLARVVIDDPKLIHRTCHLPRVPRRRLVELAHMETVTREGLHADIVTTPIPISKGEGTDQSVLIAGVAQRTLQRARQIAGALGLRVRSITTVPLALAAAIEPEPGVTLSVYLGDRATWILALDEGRWLFSRRIEDVLEVADRNASQPGLSVHVDWPARSDARVPHPAHDQTRFRLRDVVEEVDRTTHFLVRHHDSAVDRIYLIGARSLEEEFLEEVTSNIEAPMTLWAPPSMGNDADVSQYAVAAATLRVTSSAFQADLLYPEGRGRFRTACAAAALGFLILGLGLTGWWASAAPTQAGDVFEPLGTEVESLRHDVDRLADHIERLRRNDREAVFGHLQDRSVAAGPWIADLSQRTPDDVVIETFSVEVPPGTVTRHWILEGWIVASDSAIALERYHQYRSGWIEARWFSVTSEELQPVHSGSDSAVVDRLLRFRLEGELRQ